jgi:NAD(P) transhydrogenase
VTGTRYDLAVIGSGPAGQKAAIAAAKLGKRVAVVDGEEMLGGVCLKTGTIPSKTLREAVLYLTGFRQRGFYGGQFRERPSIRLEDLRVRMSHVIEHQHAVVHDQLRRNGVDLFTGMASFHGPHELDIVSGGETRLIEAEHVLVACGTRPARGAGIDFDHPNISDADQLLEQLEGELRSSLIVVGGGVIGLEYTAMAAALGIQVTLIEGRDELLDFVDRQMIDELQRHLGDHGVTFCMGETVESVKTEADDTITAKLGSGRTVRAAGLLYCVGRQPNTDRLNLEAVGLPTDKRGRMLVNEHFQTEVGHIYAAGDVIGFPALASTSAEQGRIAACHMFGVPAKHVPELLPYGIYTIPEISMVGRTERQLTEAKVPFETGLSRYAELAKARIIGDHTGLLKLIFDPVTRKLLGVHVFGDTAAELVHIGQSVMASGGTIETLRDTVFNYPTLAEAYKVAALDGLNKL